jgi:hypothetical protein
VRRGSRLVTTALVTALAYSGFVASDAGLSAQLHALLGAPTAAQARPELASFATFAKRRNTIGYALGFIDCVTVFGELGG